MLGDPFLKKHVQMNNYVETTILGLGAFLNSGITMRTMYQMLSFPPSWKEVERPGMSPPLHTHTL